MRRQRDATLPPSRRRLHRRGKTGGRADVDLHPGAFPGRRRLLRTSAWMAESVASRLRQSQYAAAALREEVEAAHGVPPSFSGGMVRPAAGTPGAARRPGLLRELRCEAVVIGAACLRNRALTSNESNGSWSVAGACTTMTKRCPRSMVSSVFCWKFGISLCGESL
ncbi:uncharacterized protein LOC129133725 [Agelaius phoeniceus]|uniref:uncharacterized protein LOC129133725 n=1 Tax=Agelaius phoeniceus TaxID=39638 RepID=UPI004054D8B3